MPDPTLAPSLPAVLAHYQPLALGKASQVSPLTLRPVTHDK